MTTTLFSRLKQFRNSEAGNLSVETVLVFPMLLWAYAAMFIYWDAFKAQNVNLKATYSVADMVSRRYGPVTPAYVDGLNDIYAFLIRNNDGNDIRVSVVRYVTNQADPEGDPVMELRWSDGTGAMSPHLDETPFAGNVPMMSLGDELIVVETQMTWSPPIDFALGFVGLSEQQFGNFVATSPRYREWICYDADTNDVCDDEEGAPSI
ncbi:MAG: hypothetical protein AAGK37_02005 [Pseudomonadota bacterium]